MILSIGRAPKLSESNFVNHILVWFWGTAARPISHQLHHCHSVLWTHNSWCHFPVFYLLSKVTNYFVSGMNLDSPNENHAKMEVLTSEGSTNGAGYWPVRVLSLSRSHNHSGDQGPGQQCLGRNVPTAGNLPASSSPVVSWTRTEAGHRAPPRVKLPSWLETLDTIH